MTIDEAIKHCLEVAEKHERHAKILKKRLLGSGLDTVDYCLQCAADHRQLAEWLTELKEARQLLKLAVEDLSTMHCNNDTYIPDSCYICVKHGNCSYTDSFKWCRTDTALKLIGGNENG